MYTTTVQTSIIEVTPSPALSKSSDELPSETAVPVDQAECNPTRQKMVMVADMINMECDPPYRYAV